MTAHSWLQNALAIALVLIALYALRQALTITRRDAQGRLAEKAKQASVTVKEDWGRRMETTKAEYNTPRSLRRW
jgi:ABC-type transport system involved in cytochrome bd biosynthesis fused ATPase/permease subunit